MDAACRSFFPSMSPVFVAPKSSDRVFVPGSLTDIFKRSKIVYDMGGEGIPKARYSAFTASPFPIHRTHFASLPRATVPHNPPL